MTAMPAAQTMTAREFLALPLRHDAGISNLVDGELVVTSPSAMHQRLVFEIAFAIEKWIRDGSGRGAVSIPIDVGIDERNVYEPDVSWYPEGQDPVEEERPYSLPAIAAEVRSPSTWRYDIGPKKSGYERQGLPELWLVDTAAEEVIAFRRSRPEASTFDVSERFGREDVLTSPQLPGFELPLERPFGG